MILCLLQDKGSVFVFFLFGYGEFLLKEDDYPGFRTAILCLEIFQSLILTKDVIFMFAKQLWHVVDAFIPAKKSKDGKRFGFMRFINVFNVDRLDLSKSFGIRKEGNSFDSVIKGATRLEEKVEELPPVIVLKDDCLSTKDVSKSLMGRVKVFASLVNLRMALSNEGFADIKIKYMGEFWVLLEFQNMELIQKFRENVSVGSWFSCIKDPSMEFQPDKRIAWVEVEGIPLKLWPRNTFNHIAAKWGDLLDVDDQEYSCFHSKRLCVHTKVVYNISEEFKIIHRGKIYWIRANEAPGWVPEFNDDVEEELDDDIDSNDDGPLEQGDNILEEGEINKKEDKSEDPFKIYPILNKLADTGGYDSKSEGRLKYPLGFSPAKLNEDNGSGIKEIRQQNDEGNSANIRPKDHISESVCSGKFKSSEVPCDGGLAQKAKKDWVRELCIKNRVNVLALQETKMESMELFCVKSCWGNYAFNFVHSDSVGNSGGILCAWDTNSFHKNSHTVSDYFIIIRGVWLKTGMETLLVWNGKVVMIGDFNEVRIKSDRFGLTFNVHDAPQLSALTLGPISFDHRPILLRESTFDYGPVPFKFFHQWLEVEGFNKFVIDSWIVAPGDKFNGMRNLMLKLRFMKAKIREWNHEIRINSKAEFHRMSIRGIMVDGTWIEKPNQVKGEFIKHFRNRFDKPLDNRITIDMCFSKSLTTQQQEELESNVSKEELKRAVWDCRVDKSPGPDGFSFGFYRHFWSTIENNVREAVNHFLTHGDIPKGCNSSFIVLTPKVLNANMVNRF
ncbi:RNA-directed DNA polymerase, eukaryota [Tanacetum coccineum]